jgi:hypothetical protein
MHDRSQTPTPKLISLAIIVGVAIFVGAVSIAFASLTFTGSGVTGDSSGIILDTSNTISIGTSTASAITIGRNSSTISLVGSVGVDTAAPAYPLDVNGSINASSGSQTGPRNVGLSIGNGQFFVTNDGNLSNLFVGNAVGANSSGSIGYYNTIVGLGSGAHIPDAGVGGSYANSFFGYDAGAANTVGYANTLLGNNAGLSNTTGVSNTMVGTNAGYDLNGGGANTFVGVAAGFFQTAGSGNIAIGPNVNVPSLTGSNQMNIGNFIYGSVSGNVGIGTGAPSTTLQVATTSATIRIGTPGMPGCLEMYDAVNSSTLEYIYPSSGALVATTTKPSNCE